MPSLSNEKFTQLKPNFQDKSSPHEIYPVRSFFTISLGCLLSFVFRFLSFASLAKALRRLLKKVLFLVIFLLTIV